MAGEPTPPKQDSPIIVPNSEIRVRKATVYPGFLAAGMTILEAEELCRLIQAVD